MFFEENLAMKRCINVIKKNFFAKQRFGLKEISSKKRQWAWFIFLWFMGLFAMAALAYPIKFLMSFL